MNAMAENTRPALGRSLTARGRRRW
jgi:hypothetical protein